MGQRTPEQPPEPFYNKTRLKPSVPPAWRAALCLARWRAQLAEVIMEKAAQWTASAICSHMHMPNLDRYDNPAGDDNTAASQLRRRSGCALFKGDFLSTAPRVGHADQQAYATCKKNAAHRGEERSTKYRTPMIKNMTDDGMRHCNGAPKAHKSAPATVCIIAVHRQKQRHPA